MGVWHMTRSSRLTIGYGLLPSTFAPHPQPFSPKHELAWARSFLGRREPEKAVQITNRLPRG
jgi:hypothetical protein